MDQFVSLPGQGNGQKYDTITLLDTIGRFARPDGWPPFQLERDLEARFASSSVISFADCLGWLTDASIRTSALETAMSDLRNGDTEQLHQSLQQATDNGNISLLWIADASKLVEVVDQGEGSGPGGLQFWSQAESCLLLRIGYSQDQGYAYYSASLPGDSRRRIKLTWESVVLAGVNAAVNVLPPIDYAALDTAMHIWIQAIATAHSATATAEQAYAQIKAICEGSQPPVIRSTSSAPEAATSQLQEASV